ncbi:radical SAM protein [Granulicella arctica]|uniref:Cyclic dehypoxanthinyl futalosine synthase n=1 Tax=Granulicella arctica TaxID=940613 RepID=A0A7Y9PLM8_9BACT|nr:dehypoxanthine futalosine cyclase [Granulicella arctica]NYF81381.1 cyclic dehypoxanthinyl futalosine synthase [Granulicella arctica]
MGISREQALDCFSSDDLIGIGMEADAVRRELHPESVVSYVVDRAICHTTPGFETRIEEAVALGATGIVLRGSVQPGMTIASFEKMLAGIHNQFPSLWLHGLSATEVVAIAVQSGLTVRETLVRLRSAGLGSISGSDAGILDDAVQTAEKRCSASEWLELHRTAHGIGIRTTASMLFGAGETMEHRVHHLTALRQLQEETGGFTAFVPAAFQPVAAGMRGFEEATAVEYLKTLAISRMVLDNLSHIQADWSAQGLKVLQMALRFGANDVGSVMPGESIVAADGTTGEDLRRVIRGAGFRPVERDTLYRTMFLN